MATLFRLAISIYQSMKQERQTTHMKDQFRAVDLNNDGKLDAREIKIYLEYLLNTRLTEMDIDDLFELYDVDKNKVLDFTEFTRMLTRYSTFTGSQCDFSELKNMKVLNAFLEFDQDGDGFISFEEIIIFLQKQGLETSYAQSYATEMFEAADVNNDGLVDFGEFKEIVGDI